MLLRPLDRGTARAARLALVIVLALASLPSCGGEDPAPPALEPVGPELQARMQGFMDALVPPLPDASTEELERFKHARQRVLNDYGDEGPVWGDVARAILLENPGAPLTVRKGLLQTAVANLGPPGESLALDVLDSYEEDLSLRTTACELLGRYHPEAAVAFLEPVLLVSKPDRTWPEGELMLGAWDAAARATGAERAPLLARLATDIYQKDAVRHRAVELLGSVDDPRAVHALEQVLKESTGNAYLRRRAAQALVELPDRDESCAIINGVLNLEVDPNMQLFLADVLENSCR